MIRVYTHDLVPEPATVGDPGQPGGRPPKTPALRERPHRTSEEALESLAKRLAPAVERVRAGGLAAFPTDTVWGVGVRGDDPVAVERVFGIKGREWDKPLACLIPSLAWLERFWSEPLPEDLLRLLRESWPGATTVILEAPEGLLPAPRRGAPGIGFRVPAHDHLRAFLELLDAPLANSSANPSGRPTPPDRGGVLAALGQHLDVLLDLPATLRGRPSRILFWRPGEPPRVLRS